MNGGRIFRGTVSATLSDTPENNPRALRNGDILYDEAEDAIIIAWPASGYLTNQAWETDYFMVGAGAGEVGYAINKRPPQEQQARLVWIGNLFGWGDE